MANFFNTSRYARDVAGDGGSGGRLKRVMHEQRFRVADSLLPKTGHVLDFGCGSGDYLKLLLARGYTGVGIDPAAALIRIAGGPEFRVGSVDDWPEGRFDVIVALSVLLVMTAEEEARFFQRARESLRPGGCVIANFYNRFIDLVTLNDFTLSAFRRNAELLGRPELAEEIAMPFGSGDTYRKRIDFRARNPFTLEREIDEQGFRVDRMLFTRFHLLPPAIVERPENFDVYRRQVEMVEESPDLGPLFATNITCRMVDKAH